MPLKLLRPILLFSFFVTGRSIEIADAQTVDQIFNRYIKSYHTSASVTLPYYLFVPEAYNPGNHYPLVLCLHGAGERGDSPYAVELNSMAIVWARDSNQARWPCFIVVPQCPVGQWWTYNNIEQNILNYLDSLTGAASIDTARLYITGLSMGGYGTWDFLDRYPAKFAAAIPMSGGGNPASAPWIKNIPIWNFHGAQDGTVPVSESRNIINALENAGDTIFYTHCHNDDCTGLPDSIIGARIAAGAKHLYTEYQYGGHMIWDEAYNYVHLLPWVFMQSKTGESSGLIFEKPLTLPSEHYLYQNYPNPFNSSTSIRYRVPTVSIDIKVVLCIYDMLGRKISTLVDERKSGGIFQARWDAAGLPTGVYICRMQLGGMAETRMLLLIR
jgi:poly(3-hydroxybutyrate) depolymerase